MLAGERESLGLMSGECIGLLCLYYGPIPWRYFLQPCLWDFEVTKLSWAQHSAVLPLAQCRVSWTLTARERVGRVCPFVQNGPFCPWCICNVVSLKSSPKFRLTFLKLIIIHSHDCKIKSSYFKFQTILATGLNKMAFTQLVPGLFYSATNFIPSHSPGHTGCRKALRGQE